MVDIGTHKQCQGLNGDQSGRHEQLLFADCRVNSVEEGLRVVCCSPRLLGTKNEEENEIETHSPGLVKGIR